MKKDPRRRHQWSLVVAGSWLRSAMYDLLRENVSVKEESESWIRGLVYLFDSGCTDDETHKTLSDCSLVPVCGDSPRDLRLC